VPPCKLLFFLQKGKNFISLICQGKSEFHRYYLQKITKVILTCYAIATFPACPGIIEEHIALQHELPDKNCPFEITDQLTKSPETNNSFN
jgi:hypothetical protein